MSSITETPTVPGLHPVNELNQQQSDTQKKCKEMDQKIAELEKKAARNGSEITRLKENIAQVERGVNLRDQADQRMRQTWIGRHCIIS